MDPREVAALATAVLPPSLGADPSMGRARNNAASWEHYRMWNSNNGAENVASWTQRTPPMKRALVATMLLVHQEYSRRDKLTSQMRKSKLSEMISAGRLIVGTYTNWAMIIGQ